MDVCGLPGDTKAHRVKMVIGWCFATADCKIGRAFEAWMGMGNCGKQSALVRDKTCIENKFILNKKKRKGTNKQSETAQFI